jgi:protein TonB
MVMMGWKNMAWGSVYSREARQRWRDEIAIQVALADPYVLAPSLSYRCLLAAVSLALLLHAVAFTWLPVHANQSLLPPPAHLLRLHLEPVLVPPLAPPTSVPQQVHKVPVTPAKHTNQPVVQHLQKRAVQPPTKAVSQPVLSTTTPSVKPIAPPSSPAAPPVKKTEAKPDAVPASPKPLATAPADEPVSEARADADYLHNPPPEYPSFAKARGWTGRVLLRVHVLASGHPDQVELQHGSGHTLLDDAAVHAVQDWRFVPAKRGATPVDSWVGVPVDFKLS